MTMLERRPELASQKNQAVEAREVPGVPGELSEADVMRGWVRYFIVNKAHPDVLEQVEKVRAGRPWDPVSPEDTVWAIGQAAQLRAMTGEQPPAPEVISNSQTANNEHIVATNGVYE